MKQRGFTLIELVVVISVISVLAAVLLDRLRYYQESAEKAAMEQTVGALRSALHLQMAERLIRGQWHDVRALVRENPMDWLAEQPGNYRGALLQATEPGNWYFDAGKRQLVYVVHLGQHFVPDRQGRREVRYELRVLDGKKAKEQAANVDNRSVEGVVLVAVAPYRWF